MNISAEQFLREKLASEIETFGDGTTEFHTRDIEHLLKCLENKDDVIMEDEQKIKALHAKINFKAEEKFRALLELCMERSNWSAEQRLNYIRRTYKEIWDEQCASAGNGA